MLECGQPAKDDTAAALVEGKIKQLEKELKLPELTESPDDDLLTSKPLQIAFSLLRVPRGVAAEKAFVDMLLHIEPDLLELNEPMVFPVFGRGRAMLPLVGAGVTPQNIHESSAFLVGPCSCEIKELNPGFDLLLAAPWDKLLYPDGPPPVLAAGFETPVSDKVELVPIPSGSGAASSAEAPRPATGPVAAVAPAAADPVVSPPAAEASAAVAEVDTSPPEAGLAARPNLLVLASLVGMVLLVVAIAVVKVVGSSTP
jgi:hypothetical protein